MKISAALAMAALAEKATLESLQKEIELLQYAVEEVRKAAAERAFLQSQVPLAVDSDGR